MPGKLPYSKNRLKLTTALIVCFFCIGFSAKLCAQTDTVKKLKEVKVKNKPLPNVQTATPAQQINANDFERYSAFNVADAIRDFSGVTIKDYGGLGGLKTVSVRGLGANQTAVLYDGVQLNDAENGQVDLGKLNLNGVQQITLYNAQPDDILTPARSFASASIIAINPTRPNLTAGKPSQFLIGINSGSFGLINPYLQWQQRINKRWSFVVNSYWEKANGRYKYKVNGDGSDTSTERSNADLNAQEADGALYWAKSDSNKFALHINYFNSDRGLPGAIIFYNQLSSRQRLWDRDYFMQGSYKRLWQSGISLLLNTKLSREYTRYIDPDFLNGHNGIDDRYTQRELYQSASVSYKLFKTWEVSYATDFSITDLNVNLPQYAYPTRVTLLNALASNFTAGRWKLQGSLLKSYVTETVETGSASPARSVLSPTIIVTYQPFASNNLQLRAFYKDIFRNPTLDEQYYFSTSGSRGIKPEYAKQYDIGITYRKALNSFFNDLTFTADAYHNNVTDKIIALPNKNPAISTIINLGKVKVNGTDISIKTQTETINNWKGVISLNYTYQYAVDEDANTVYYLNQIPYTPKNTLAVNAGADHGQFGIYYNQVLTSSRYYLGQSIPQNYVDGYAVSDLSVIYRLHAGKNYLALTANVNNLFNENYMIVQSFPMPGRSYRFSVQIKI